MTETPRTVLITGASAGIGAACVLRFATAGWRVAAAARRTERLETLAAEARAAAPGAEILPLPCDVADSASVAAAFQALHARFGALDALVNNAGYGHYGTLEQARLEDFQASMETNYLGAVRCTQAALPLLKAAAAARGGRWGANVVCVSSIVGRRAFPGAGAYCASKFALEGFAEALRVELRSLRIGVSVVNPGLTRTEFFESAGGQRPPGFLQPEGGMPPEVVARTILRCARSPRRNVYLTLPGKLAVLAQWLSPRLLDAVLARTWQGKAPARGKKESS
ncbi:MAG: SDR family NAD(P)-dependent oxidoreductase [Planctomycetota bacterium]|nr:SDR family NAD(P)-dependent oxidoreductase [Planctomycetota bacterium]